MREPIDHHITNNTTYHEPITALSGVISLLQHCLEQAVPLQNTCIVTNMLKSHTEAGEEKTAA